MASIYYVEGLWISTSFWLRTHCVFPPAIGWGSKYMSLNHFMKVALPSNCQMCMWYAHLLAMFDAICFQQFYFLLYILTQNLNFRFQIGNTFSTITRRSLNLKIPKKQRSLWTTESLKILSLKIQLQNLSGNQNLETFCISANFWRMWSLKLLGNIIQLMRWFLICH